MYIKCITLENFKSFGNKISIPFLPGFTAITGPNGSGKSNIVDAILFLLGIRSPKMIRAERLVDLIYKGNKEANYCKVSIVFDNSSRKIPVDSDEIVLTRKIKISPLPDNPSNFYSYFYINGKSASLNEFVDLLSSAHISPTCIVQQGDVTSIVEMGDFERRKLIDEVAGIADFDRDIEKAKRERDEVEKNMEHISIVLDEIKKQLRQLKKEKDEAIKYKEKVEEFNKTKAMLSYKKKIEIEKEIKEVQKQIDYYEKEKINNEKELFELKKKYKEKQISFQEIENKLMELGGEEILKIKEKIDFFREENIKAKEKINYYRKEIAEKKGEAEQIKGLINKIIKEEEKCENAIENIKKEIEKTDKEISLKEKEVSQIKAEIEKTDEKTVSLSREIAKIKKEIEKAKEDMHSLLLERDRTVQKRDGLSTKLNELMNIKNNFDIELKELKMEIGEAQKVEKERRGRKEQLEKKLFEKKKEEASIGEKLREVEREILRLQRELSKLKLSEDISFSPSTKEILRLRDEGIIRGIHGSIAELVKVDDKYRKAIEVAAGRRAEAVVVENDEVAAKCIDYLKKNDYGRVTFLPLNKMVAGKPRGRALLVIRNENVLGFAMDLVSYDKKYEPAVWYVLGDTIVVNNLDAARSLMGGIRMVTLDGELIEPSGAITGGSLPKGGLFEMCDLKKSMELKYKLSELSREQEELTDAFIKIKEEIGKIDNELKILPDYKLEEIEKYEVRKREIEGKLKVINDELRKLENELNEINSVIMDYEGKIKEKQNEISQLEELRKRKEEEVISIASEEKIKKINFLKEEIEKLKEESRNLIANLRGKEKEREVILSQKNEIERRLGENEIKLKEMEKELAEEERRYDESGKEIKAYEEIEKKIISKTKGLSEERDKLYKEIVEIEKIIDNLSTKMEATIDIISKTKARLPSLESALSEIMDINYEFKEEEILSIDEIKKRMKELEEAIQKMEPVNMKALEEYEKQEERKKKFEEDYNRLKEQRDNLIKLEEEIKNKKNKTFYEVFNEIRKNFIKIYSELSGAEGDLILQNPENPFEGGLTIKVKKNGKTMSLYSLSGGEKSIASLAFIFSMQAYEPSPFYILDEIDMFLDEKNAEKIAKMILSNSSSAQFIVVSLRRVTIKNANHIYGVTISNGVSTIVGNINIKELEKMAEIK
ncbi:MAG: chromosome segregation protein SMC [Thermoplasmatales archaeon]|nr:chromosome segregation protein SMC [Thermoplasmatales archaeon]